MRCEPHCRFRSELGYRRIQRGSGGPRRVGGERRAPCGREGASADGTSTAALTISPSSDQRATQPSGGSGRGLTGCVRSSCPRTRRRQVLSERTTEEPSEGASACFGAQQAWSARMGCAATGIPRALSRRTVGHDAGQGAPFRQVHTALWTVEVEASRSAISAWRTRTAVTAERRVFGTLLMTPGNSCRDYNTLVANAASV